MGTRRNQEPNRLHTDPELSEKIRIVKKIAILGSTGSIGTSTLSICESFPDRYQPVSLAAGRNLEAALAQSIRWRPRLISMATEELADELRRRLRAGGITCVEVAHGTEGMV